MKNILKWRNFYFSILFITFIIIALVPFLVKSEVFGIKESIFEFILISVALSIIYVINYLYFREISRMKKYQVSLEDRLQETFKYIGSINLQMEEMRQAFSNFKKYPESKKDIQTVLNYFSEKILSMVNADWIILRIIDSNTGRTIRDNKLSRNNTNIRYAKFNNRELLEGRCHLDNCVVVRSDQVNLNIKVCCILPAKLDENQEFFIRSMLIQLEMLYIIFSSLRKIKKGKKL